jgi:hypothetical protein
MTAKPKTDAETLHRAAHEIRDDSTIATRSVRPFLTAVADFLQECGEDLTGAAGNYDWCNGAMVQNALTIARAYLGDGAR